MSAPAKQAVVSMSAAVHMVVLVGWVTLDAREINRESIDAKNVDWGMLR